MWTHHWPRREPQLQLVLVSNLCLQGQCGVCSLQSPPYYAYWSWVEVLCIIAMNNLWVCSPYETCCHLHLAPTDTWIFWSFEKEKRQGGAICDQSRHKERSPRYLESTELLLTRRFFTSFDYLMNFLQSLDCLHWLITLQFCLLITTSFGFVVVV